MAVTVEPLGDLREAIAWVGAAGARGVQLDAVQLAAADVLGGSALRDLRATMRRAEVECSGLDAWVDAAAWSDDGRVEDALHALVRALDVAEALGRPPVTLALPRSADDARAEAVRRDAVGALVHAAERRGVRLADIHAAGSVAPTRAPASAAGVHAPAAPRAEHAAGSAAPMSGGDTPAVPPAPAVPAAWPFPPLGACVDAAAEIAAGRTPGATVLALGERVVAARVADLLRTGLRGPLGCPDGQLDPLEFRMALEATGFTGLPVVDARRWPSARRGIAQTIAVWTECASGGS